MPDVNSMFPSNWMKVGDLNGGTIDAVVSHVVQEEVKQGEMLWVVHFQPNPQLPRASNGGQAGAVLKTQNAESIATVYGPNTDMWSGQTIQLYVKQTNMGPGIGMRPSAAAFKQAAHMPATPAPAPAATAPVGPGQQAAMDNAAQAPLPTQAAYGAGPAPAPYDGSQD